MSIRRTLIGSLGVVAFSLAACSSSVSSGAPSAASSDLALPGMPSVAVELEGFCADFSDKVAATWPNLDASTATAVAPLIQGWASRPELVSVQADVSTIATWVSTAATTGETSTPPPDVTTAFERLKAFADANC